MWAEVDNRIRRALAGVRNAYRGVVALARVDGPVAIIQLDGLDGEKISAEYMQHFGLASRPPKGSQCVMVALGGRTGHSVVIATEHGEYRFKQLEDGEVALYSMDGAVIHLKRGKIVDVQCDEYRVSCKTYAVSASAGATFTTPDLTASDKITAKTDVVVGEISLVGHHHKVGGVDSTVPIL